jgi:DnaK suppressor protein
MTGRPRLRSTAPPRPDLVAHLPLLRAKLEEQRGFRIEQLEQLGGTAVGGFAGAGGVDGSSQLGEVPVDPAREVNALLLAGARQALADIENALQRIRTGRYGLCVSCTRQIPLDRLLVIPQTGACPACSRRIDGTAPR